MIDNALQVTAVPWTRISDAASANAFADKIAAAPRALFGGGTSISGAIDTSMALLFDSPFKAARRVNFLIGKDGAIRKVFSKVKPDGHAQERSLLDEVLARVQKRDVWIADRNFCTLKFLFEIAKKLGFFIIRQHGAVKGKLCGQRVFKGEGPTGKTYEQPVEFIYEGKTYKLRRITVELLQATRDGDMSLHLLTNLPAKVSAPKVAELYRRRWTIETLFLEVTTTLTCVSPARRLGLPR